MRDTLNLAHEFYGNPNLHVSDIRLTKLIDFENIASRFRVDIRLYEPVACSVWKIVFGQVQHRGSLSNVDIGLFEGHCIYMKDLNILTNHWECVRYTQRISRQDNYNRHITEKQCTGGQPKFVCDGSKFKCIMRNSEKICYGANRHEKFAGGQRASPSLVVGTFITHCVAMEVKGA